MEIKKPIKPSDLRKITTVANELGIVRVKVYQLIEAGSIDHIKIDGSPVVVINSKYHTLKNEYGK